MLQALNENVEGMRSFLLSLVPEDPAELKKFMECLPQLQALVEQQTKFNSELVESVRVITLDCTVLKNLFF